MTDLNCVYFYMKAFQNAFVLIRSKPDATCNTSLLTVLDRYLDSLSVMNPKELAKVKKDLLSISIDQDSLDYIIGELEMTYQVTMGFNSMTFLLDNVSVLRDIVSALKSVLESRNKDRIRDLADAVHNYPEFLLKDGEWNSSEFWKTYIKPYRKKWDPQFLENWKSKFSRNTLDLFHLEFEHLN